MITSHFTAIFWNLKKVVSQKKWGQIIVALAYLIIFFFFFLGIFFLGKSIFRFLLSFSEVSRPIARYLLLSSLGFTGLASILSFMFALSQRFYEKKLSVYFLAPVPPLAIFTSIFWENFLLGGWPFIVLALPLLLAYLAVNGAGIGSYTLLLLLIFQLTILTESIGAILAITFRSLFGQKSKKLMIVASFLTFLFLAMFLKNVFLPSALWEIAKRPSLPEVFSGLASLPLSRSWLPTTLFLDALSPSLGHLLILFGQTVLLYSVSLILAEKLYLTTWQKSQEGVFIASPGQKIKASRAATFHGQFLSLLKKEFLVIDRSLASVLYLALVFFMATLFFFFLAQNQKTPEFAPTIFPKIAAITLIIISYLTTMVALRFAFPSMVLELRTFWVIARLPNVRKELFRAKWLAQTVLLILISWVLLLSAVFFLRLPFDLFSHLWVLGMSAVLIIASSHLFIGGINAKRLPREDIEQITTAFSAILATLISIFTGLFAGAVFFSKTAIDPNGQIYLKGGEENLFILGGLLSFALLIWFVAYSLAQIKFKRVDI